MRKAFLVLALLALPCAAEEPVVRVQNIQPADGAGKSILLQKHPQDNKGFPVTVNATGYVKDHFITDNNTLAALEFLIGGRVGINKATDIEIVTDRSVADGKTDVKRIILKSGSLWVKADAAQLKQPLEIQTNGGTMGIKGTEFTVEEEEDGTIQVCCFESHSPQGGIEIRDESGQLIGRAEPGDEVRFRRRSKPVFRKFKDIRQFREKVLSGRRFGALHRNPYFAKNFLGELGSYPPAERARLYHYAQTHGKVERQPARRWQRQKAALRRGQISANLTFPSNLVPDGQDPMQKAVGPYPTFSWRGVARTHGYVINLSKDPEGEEVVFTTRVRGFQAAYPSEMRPLEAGRYYWRVIPVDASDKPVHEASQTDFVVEATPSP